MAKKYPCLKLIKSYKISHQLFSQNSGSGLTAGLTVLQDNSGGGGGGGVSYYCSFYTRAALHR